MNKTALMHKTALKAGMAGLALAATVGLAGCGGGMGNMPMGSSTPAPSSTPSASSSSSISADFNDADVTFTQMMIPHHTQAVAMSDTILKKSGVNAEVTALAQQIKDAQQPEITTMTGFLKTWGKDMGDMGGMGGMDMGDGMATDAELKQLDQADGATAQKMYLEMMTKHHQGAIKMAQTEITNGKNPDAVQLAKDIVTAQQKEITTIKQILTRL